MLDYVDERLSLAVERGALLWCLRIWGMGGRRPPGSRWQVPAILGWLGAPDAALPFDDFMQTVSEAANRQIGIDCVYGRRISEDEHILLDTLALAQNGRVFEALLLLRQMMDGQGASAACRKATALGHALARAARFLDAPEGGTFQVALSNQIQPTHFGRHR